MLKTQQNTIPAGKAATTATPITMPAIIQPSDTLQCPVLHLSVLESQHSPGAQSESELHDSPTQLARQVL